MLFRLRNLGVRREESAAVVWSWLFFFAVLSAYYVIRPIRDELGVASGVDSLPWLFSGSLAGMLLANPLFSFVAARLSRPRFVSLSYGFFALNLLIFFTVFRAGSTGPDISAGRVFYIWTSVFNMFVVSIFWSVMADVFSAEQGRRLFGIIAAAGTIGSITGAALTSWLVAPIGTANLLLVSAALLQVAAIAARRLFRFASRGQGGQARIGDAEQAAGIGGTAWEGARRSFADPYFLNVTLHMVLFTVLTTFLYFQQATLVDQAITDRTERTQFFANIDLVVNLIALATQMFATGWFIRAFGVTAALAFLPVASVIGFGSLALVPTVGVLMGFQIVRRAGNFAINRPAREVLFTAASPRDRYKTKSFIDTFVYRAGDQIGAWAYAPLVAAGLGITGTSIVAGALGVLSTFNAIWLGRKWRRLGTGDATESWPRQPDPMT